MRSRRPTARPGEDRGAVDHRLDRHAGVAQDLAPERVERPHADGPGATPSGATRGVEPLGHLDSAARLLNVIARIVSGGVPESISHAARATSVVVLPLPAGAMHSDGPGGAVAAARWSGASRASRSTTDGWDDRAAISAG